MHAVPCQPQSMIWSCSYAAISYSYHLAGLQFDDQGLVNTDPRTIAVPLNSVNMIPTDINGLSFARTPAMVRANIGV